MFIRKCLILHTDGNGDPRSGEQLHVDFDRQERRAFLHSSFEGNATVVSSALCSALAVLCLANTTYRAGAVRA
eukprot:1488858-Rhodomonas_salina.1